MTDHIVPTAVYLRVWVALLILLGATIGLAYVPLGSLHLVVAIVISFAKAILIVLFFMHVKYKPKLTLVFVCSGLFWLGILFALTFGDYLTRGWLPLPAAWAR